MSVDAEDERATTKTVCHKQEFNASQLNCIQLHIAFVTSLAMALNDLM